jgi:Ca2+-binding RTX toxin-like protein
VASTLRLAIASLLLVVAASMSPAGAGGATCFGQQATIEAEQQGVTEGTAGPDVIIGTGGSDVIKAKGGNDRICGVGGDDQLLGGGGNDKMAGGGGSDKMAGGPDVDTVSYKSNPGPVLVFLNGVADDGNPTFRGGEGEDDNVTASVENLIGSKGHDLFEADDDPNAFFGRAGDDRFFGEGGADKARGGEGHDTPLNGEKGPDDIAGGPGRDQLFGEGGNDRLIGNGGNDFADGGGGTDTCKAEEEDDCEQNP